MKIVHFLLRVISSSVDSLALRYISISPHKTWICRNVAIDYKMKLVCSISMH